MLRPQAGKFVRIYRPAPLGAPSGRATKAAQRALLGRASQRGQRGLCCGFDDFGQISDFEPFDQNCQFLRFWGLEAGEGLPKSSTGPINHQNCHLFCHLTILVKNDSKKIAIFDQIPKIDPGAVIMF